jgi:predicted RNase H-like HicB family nuclease
MANPEYPVVIEPLSTEDGGGFMATVPDLPGCMSDGESREEAARNVAEAIAAWIDEATRLGRPVPAPSAHLVLAAE